MAKSKAVLILTGDYVEDYEVIQSSPHSPSLFKFFSLSVLSFLKSVMFQPSARETGRECNVLEYISLLLFHVALAFRIRFCSGFLV